MVITVPWELYEKLKQKKLNKEIMSYADFIRHLLYSYFEGGFSGGAVVMTRRVTVEESISFPIPRRPQMSQKVATYGKHHLEVLKQLKVAIQKKIKR